MQNRFKSYVLWVSVASFVSLITKTFFNYEIANYDEIVTAILTIAVLTGIINNPTDAEKF